jgi:hypothetical protein
MAQLLAKRREAMADPSQSDAVPVRGLIFRAVRREVPLLVGDGTHKIGGQAMEHLAVPNEIVDRHPASLAARSPTMSGVWVSGLFREGGANSLSHDRVFTGLQHPDSND